MLLRDLDKCRFGLDVKSYDDVWGPGRRCRDRLIRFR